MLCASGEDQGSEFQCDIESDAACVLACAVQKRKSGKMLSHPLPVDAPFLTVRQNCRKESKETIQEVNTVARMLSEVEKMMCLSRLKINQLEE